MITVQMTRKPKSNDPNDDSICWSIPDHRPDKCTVKYIILDTQIFVSSHLLTIACVYRFDAISNSIPPIQRTLTYNQNFDSLTIYNCFFFFLVFDRFYSLQLQKNTNKFKDCTLIRVMDRKSPMNVNAYVSFCSDNHNIEKHEWL